VYGQVWIDGATAAPGQTPQPAAQLGYGPEGSDPARRGLAWVDASFNVDAGNNDEFMASMLPTRGAFRLSVYRYSTTGGRDWLYADLNGPIGRRQAAHPTRGKLTWPGTPTRTADNTYDYYLVAVDSSYNRSGPSNTVTATAAPRTVSVTFNVTVPNLTPAASTVYIAGSLHLLDGNLPEWDPAGVSLTQVGPYAWEITLTGAEGTSIEYKYALGSWDFVEKGPSCEEINNRSLTLNYGSTGTMLVNDIVANWRNVSPCGN
jgi:hypothetical protein